MKTRRSYAFGLLFSSLLLLSNLSFAQKVVVKGVGPDKNSALRDASRNAVEQVVGTYIDSKTLISKNVVALDEIYAKSQGFIRNVTVLDSKQGNNGWEVTAKIDVNTNPDSQLMSRVAMIAQLNDPRIGVVVTYHGNEESEDKKSKYPIVCTAAINENLIRQGFTHVVIPQSNEETELSGLKKFENVDFIVMGKLDVNANDIKLPKYSDYTNENAQEFSVVTGLQRALAELDVKVVRADTQEIVGEFHVEGDAIQNDVNRSENVAVALASSRASEKVKELFKRAASSVEGNVQIKVRTDSYEQVISLEQELRQTAGVQNVSVKSYENGKGTVFVSTNLLPNQLFKQLKTKSNLNLFLENVSANLLEISMG